MEDVVKKLKELQDARVSVLAASGTQTELDANRNDALKDPVYVSLVSSLPTLPKDLKPAAGKQANEYKTEIEKTYRDRKEALRKEELNKQLSSSTIDVSLPGTGRRLGHVHPLTQVTNELITIFYGMGFSVVEGPEIETDYYNFDALNTPPSHPARDEQDTFYTAVGPQVLLRSQTSTVQVRAMERMKPPLRVISPGRVYRNEEVNARKYPLFHQVEGLVVDHDVTFGQLKGTLNEFIRLLFGKPLNTRFRPDFFPFTEPSAELDCQCPFCMGEGCRTCGHRGWIELLGCGMVDPNVLEGAGINSQEYSGFAFGMGIDRLAMMKYGINDIRHLFTSDMRFLEQF